MPATFPDSEQPDVTRVVNWRYVTPGYFSLLKIRHLAGRAINDADRAGATPIAVVNETFARQNYGGVQAALGRRIVVAKESPREIVGVVTNTIGWALGDPPRAMMFVPLAQVEPSIARIAHSFFPPRWIVRSSLDTAAHADTEHVIREAGSIAAFHRCAIARFADDALDRDAALLSGGLDSVCCVRRAVGGGRRVCVVFLRGGQSDQRDWRAPGVGRGAPGAYRGGPRRGRRCGRLLRSVLFGVSAADPFTYLAVGIALVATVLLAALFPALRAARVDPLAAIRRYDSVFLGGWRRSFAR